MDFRNGHGIYLALFMSFSNFILIAYNFAIQKVSALSILFDNLTIFVGVFIAIYVPLAMIIGYWHRRNQYSVEVEALNRENWENAWISLTMIKLVQGKATEEELDQVIRYYRAILKRQNKEHLIPKDMVESKGK